MDSLTARENLLRAITHDNPEYVPVRRLDDYGGQQSLLLGPKLWRRFIKPELARIIDAAKRGGAFFWLHSCGHIMGILPDVVEIGVDGLDPVQVWANHPVSISFQPLTSRNLRRRAIP